MRPIKGSIVALVNYMSQILLELIKLANLIVLISRAIASAKRLESVFEMESSIKDGSEKNADGNAPAVAFSDVSLIYREGGEPSLRNITFTVQHSGSVQTTGSSGMSGRRSSCPSGCGTNWRTI